MSAPNIGLGEWFFLRLLQLSEEDKVAQIFADDGTAWKYSKLFEHSVHVAVGLQEMGLKSGQSTLALVVRNSHELFSISYGCFMADIRLVPMIAELSAENLASGFKAARPTHILTAPSKLPTMEEAISLADLEPPPKILTLTDDLYEEIIARGSHIKPKDYRPVKINNPKTHSPISYFSSGTTGPPKAVALSDRGILRAMFNGRAALAGNNTPMLNISQCNWVTWLFFLGRSLHAGRCRVFMNLVDIKRILDTIQKFKCDIWYAPPRVLIAAEMALDAYPGAWDISSLKAIMSGGDSINDVIQERLAKKFGTKVYQEYGSTEAGYVFYADIGKPVVLGSIGKPCLPVKLVDTETGETIIEPNTPGELYIKDVMMIEYQGDPKATAEAFQGDWMPSGDLMTFDENGNYFFIERIKEIFKYNGHQVVPSELEEIISKIPEVMEAAVVGKVDPKVGEYPTAFIIKRPGSKVTSEDVNNFLLQCDLPDWYKLRGGIVFTDEIPKTASGKISRKNLKNIVNSPDNKD